jgi:hypothetical protein
MGFATGCADLASQVRDRIPMVTCDRGDLFSVSLFLEMSVCSSLSKMGVSFCSKTLKAKMIAQSMGAFAKTKQGREQREDVCKSATQRVLKMQG